MKVDFWTETSQAIRLARRGRMVPGSVAFLAVVTCAMSGVGTAIFDSVVLHPLAFAAPDRLVVLQSFHVSDPTRGQSPSPPDVASWQRAQSLASVAAWYARSSFMSSPAGLEHVNIAAVTPNFFDVLGVPVQQGPGFGPEASRPGMRFVVLDHGAWVRHVGGRPPPIDTSITIGAAQYQLRGASPATFRIPGSNPDAFESVPFITDEGDRGARAYLTVVARIASGYTIDQVATELDVIAHQLEDAYPATNRGWRVSVTPGVRYFLGQSQEAVGVLIALTLLALLLAAGAVANVFLARAVDHTAELQARVALGATPLRTISHYALEAFVLGAFVWTAAVPLSIGAILLIQDIGFERVGLQTMSISRAIVGAFTGAALLACVSAAASGSWVAYVVRAGSGPWSSLLRDRTGRTGFNRLLFVLQIGSSTALVFVTVTVGAAVMRLKAISTGFDAESVISAKIPLDAREFTTPGTKVGAFDRIASTVRAGAGVLDAGFVSVLPFGDQLLNFEVRYTPQSQSRPDTSYVAEYRVVSPGYFETMRIRVIAGRPFRERDDSTSESVIIVNESFAKSHWPHEDPVGKRVIIRYLTDETRTIVGVVGNTLDRRLTELPTARVYVPLAQAGYVFNTLTLAVRVVDAAGFAQRLRDAVGSVSPTYPAYDVRMLRSRIDETLVRQRIVSWVALALAITGLFVSGFAVYGLVSYRLSARARELAVRIAMGAQMVGLLVYISRDHVFMTGLGLAVGGLATMWLGEVVGAFVPIDYALQASGAFAAFVAVAVATILGAVLPFWRLSRVQPATLLRDR